jgi:hypothetical protein
MRFEVGMQVICIKNHSEKVVIKGQSFIISEIKNTECCGLTLLDIGIRTELGYTLCSCGKISHVSDCAYWIDALLFIPVQKDAFKSVSWEHIVEEIPVCAN